MSYKVSFIEKKYLVFNERINMRDLEFTENEKVEFIYDVCAGIIYK